MAVRVLIVDDQERFREVARIVVEATEGFEVAAEAATGAAATRLAGSLKPDLVLMDVNLSDVSGTVVTGRILTQNGGIVVLLVSTYEESDYAAYAAECGAAGYIPKAAFSPRRLREAWALATGRRLKAAPPEPPAPER